MEVIVLRSRNGRSRLDAMVIGMVPQGVVRFTLITKKPTHQPFFFFFFGTQLLHLNIFPILEFSDQNPVGGAQQTLSPKYCNKLIKVPLHRYKVGYNVDA